MFTMEVFDEEMIRQYKTTEASPTRGGFTWKASCKLWSVPAAFPTLSYLTLLDCSLLHYLLF
ncbi:MAG: hypothetical protein K8R13_07315, partial [Methanococcoides sp.]|nr:hypothetical protein [Methanococcoides sp.]